MWLWLYEVGHDREVWRCSHGERYEVGLHLGKLLQVRALGSCLQDCFFRSCHLPKPWHDFVALYVKKSFPMMDNIIGLGLGLHNASSCFARTNRSSWWPTTPWPSTMPPLGWKTALYGWQRPAGWRSLRGLPWTSATHAWMSPTSSPGGMYTEPAFL